MKKISTLTFSALGLVMASSASAQILGQSASRASVTGLGTADPRDVIGTILSAFLGLLALIALILIVYAGFRWMTAGGNEEQVNKAKQTLQRALIGLIIIMGAYGISLYVFNIIANATS